MWRDLVLTKWLRGNVVGAHITGGYLGMVIRRYRVWIDVWVGERGAGVPRTVPDRLHSGSGGTNGFSDGPSSGTLGRSADRS